MLFLLACGIDPIVSVVSPEDGDRFASGFTATFEATVRADSEVTLRWLVDGSDLAGDSAFDGVTATMSTTALGFGEPTITLEAVDESGAAGEDSVTVTVFDNLAPTVLFLSPAEGASLVGGEPIIVQAEVDDADGGGEMSLAWSGAAAGSTGAPSFLAGPGTVSFTLVTSESGSLSVGLTATDRYGAYGSESVNFTTSPPDIDLDDDGFDDEVLGGDDCDDADATIHPGADEFCDGIDNDCSGEIDDEVVYFDVYADNDADGYGAGAVYSDCVVPSGYSRDNTDCNDASASISPGADEVCDAADLDEDCDGRADDADGSVVATDTYYADVDRDGYGDDANWSLRCDGNDSWIEVGGDCDDREPLAWTGADEVCEDGIDNDCSGGDPRCPLAGAYGLDEAALKLTGPAELALAGHGLAVADVDGDGLDDLAVGAWGYGAGGTVFRVSALGLASGTLAGDTLTAEAAGDGLGYTAASCGDVDGDGLADVVAGAPYAASDKGAVYLWLGATGSVGAGSADDEVNGSTGDGLGRSLDCGGDLDGDGDNDAVAGGGGTSVSYAYDAATLTRLAKWSGGSAVARLDDTDGDGIDDLLIGAYGSDRAYLLLGGALSDAALSSAADATFSGEASGDEAGAAVARLGDIDGDGLGDYGVGAPENDSNASASGAAYLLLGSAAPASASLSTGVRVAGDDGADRAGAALATPGDVDGDGLSDVLVGAYYDDMGGTGAGAAALLHGSASLAGLDFSATDAQFVGESDGDSAGESLSGGDIDGDGFADVLVGAPSEASAGGSAGAAYLLFGGGR
ncbi:MAG: FG-GAP repeat protein [Deltaproteobacteria bacterium]|nr:FG-GAP repeat protein [Deltaproteobacteria bacterium]